MLKWLCILSLSLEVCLCGNIAPAALVPVGAKTSNSSENTKIVGGYNARLGEAPWQVCLFGSRGSCYCGGTLLSPQVVVTAAHCMYRDGAYIPPQTIQLGGLDYRKLPLKYTVKENFVHSDYDQFDDSDKKDDIALIILNDTINIDSQDYIKPASLPDYNAADANFENKNVLISGWGRTRGSSSVKPNYLQAALVKIFPQVTCKKVMNSPIYQDRYMICAAGEDYSELGCMGDSGGPLVLQLQGENILLGITSWGPTSCKNYPGVYVKVTKYVDWIKEKAEEGNAPLSSTMNNPSIIIISGFILMHVFLSLSRR